MKYELLTPQALKSLHDACSSTYKSDRSLADLEKELAHVQGEYFGVDEFHDWNAHVRRLEAELANHGVDFTPIGLIG